LRLRRLRNLPITHQTVSSRNPALTAKPVTPSISRPNARGLLQ
jgi:hypothetical protein